MRTIYHIISTVDVIDWPISGQGLNPRAPVLSSPNRLAKFPRLLLSLPNSPLRVSDGDIMGGQTRSAFQRILCSAFHFARASRGRYILRSLCYKTRLDKSHKTRWSCGRVLYSSHSSLPRHSWVAKHSANGTERRTSIFRMTYNPACNETTWTKIPLINTRVTVLKKDQNGCWVLQRNIRHAISRFVVSETLRSGFW